MNLLTLTTDNITELLIKVIKFTQIRQRILTQNIHSIQVPGFVPKDLAVEEFSDLLNNAIVEHIQNHRLVMRDTENIKFGLNGSIEIKPVVDEYAKELLEEDRDEYLKLQINKLSENSINQKVAAGLLRQKQGTISIDYCD